MLKIMVQLIIFVYIVMMAISTLNLVVSIGRQQESKTEVDAVRISVYRIFYTAHARVIQRVLVNIANGIEPEKTPLFT